MGAGTDMVEIRAALGSIDDKPAFLLMLKETARRFNTHIICFNADMLAGRRHAESAVMHAVRSFGTGDSISDTLEMEVLLYAAGSRQCSVAVSFGLHDGENHLWVCCTPPRERVWVALAPVLHVQDDKIWDGIDPDKRKRLMKIFKITKEECFSLDNRNRIADLVIERVALLDVLR
jgi:KEOPS complex subunit Cgi121